MQIKMFEKRMFNSLIDSKNVTDKERWLGYLIGPIGAILLNAVLASFLNTYYTDVLMLKTIWGGLFLTLFPLVSKIIDAITNIVMGYIIDRTQTKQGKARPWLFISAPLVAISGVLLFAVPNGSNAVKAIWVLISYNLFYSFAFTIYSMSHSLMVPLSTRNVTQRGGLSVFNQISTIMVSGIIVALIFPALIMPALGIRQEAWITVMSIMSILTLPLILLEYYFTKERITEEKKGSDDDNKVPFKLQLKAIFTDKYFILLILYFLIYTIGCTLKNVGLIYYCNYVLGTYFDGVTQTLVSVLGGIPMGIGIFLVWPLAKKFGKRNVTMVGFIIYAIGSLICWLFPTNLILVLVGQFIKNIGGLPCAYVFMALFADTLDHLEWKTGFRSDGTAMSIYNVIMVAAAGICTGIFNYFLFGTGYIEPVQQKFYLSHIADYEGILTQKTMEDIMALDPEGTVAFIQPVQTNNFITFAFVGLEVITGVLCALTLFFVNVEKTVHKKQEVLVEREKEAFAKEGKAWLPLEERNRIEKEAQDKEAEEIYELELQKKCELKGLNYEQELSKHLEDVRQKKEKLLLNQKKAEEKNKLKEEKEKRKHEARLAKMSKEALDKYNAKNRLKEEKLEAFWQKEKEIGNNYYQKSLKELESLKG